MSTRRKTPKEVNWSVLGPLYRFMKSKLPNRAEALRSLRLVYLLAFSSQLLFVLVVGLVLLLVTGPRTGSSPLAGQILLALSLLELPLALILAERLARPGGKGGALSGVIVLGVILATPAWFALLAWLSGSTPPYPALLLMVLALFYGIGFVRAGSYVRMALSPPKAHE